MFCTEESLHVADLIVLLHFLEIIALSSSVFRICVFFVCFFFGGGGGLCSDFSFKLFLYFFLCSEYSFLRSFSSVLNTPSLDLFPLF